MNSSTTAETGTDINVLTMITVPSYTMHAVLNRDKRANIYENSEST